MMLTPQTMALSQNPKKWHGNPAKAYPPPSFCGNHTQTLIGRVDLIHLFSQYAPWMRRPMCPWKKLIICVQGGITCGATGCANWLKTCIHLVVRSIYVLVASAIDASIANNPGFNLLWPFTNINVGVELFCIRKSMYIPSPSVRILLGTDLVPVNYRVFRRVLLVDASVRAYFQALLDWI